MKGAPHKDDLALRRALSVAQKEALRAQENALHAIAKAANAEAANTDLQATITLLKLQIEKMRRELYGQSSERGARLADTNINQMELLLEECEATATEDELLAEQAAAKTVDVKAFTRTRSPRKPFPEHLPRERVVVDAPTSCECCGSDKLVKLGEDVTETLEVIPRSWKVIQTVREKFSCRACEKISQPPAPFHVNPRGLFGPSLLAMILFEKFGQHQPLNRQCERYAHEGVDVSLSTVADQVGACMITLMPLFKLIEAEALKAERLHGDDTTVPVLAKGKTDIARVWTYVRDDRPFGGTSPPVALFYYARDRRGEHPQGHLADYTGILQADAYAGYNELFKPGRTPGPITRALCWAHARRKFFELADIASQAKRRKPSQINISPMAAEAVKRIDAIFEIERAINGKSADERRSVRQDLSTPLVKALEAWMREQRAKLSRHDPVAKIIDYMLKDWSAFTGFLADGRICLTNNAAERALRGIALGRKSWLFCGSDRGGQRAAFMYTLIVTAKMNAVDPQAWLANVLVRINAIPQSRLHELLPWNWIPQIENTSIVKAA